MGEFVPDVSGLGGRAVQAIFGVVGVAVNYVPHSHTYGGRGSANESAESDNVLMILRKLPPSMLEVQV